MLGDEVVVVQYQDFVVRAWQPGDRQFVSDLVCTVLAEYGMGFEPDQADRDAVWVEEAYWQTGGEFWVAEYENSVIGSGGYHPSHRAPKAAELRKMFILPAYRGQGLGRFMLRQLEQSAVSKGFTEMWLETATVLKEATQLYESSGYQRSTGVETQRCDRVYYKLLSAASM